MPTYTYYCENCKHEFELFFSIKNYIENAICDNCNRPANRSYITDVLTQTASVKKGDHELKTLGDLADRNRDKLTDQQKMDLHVKHNSYKENYDDGKPLPNGMTRIKKQPKTIWPGSSKKKRRTKHGK